MPSFCVSVVAILLGGLLAAGHPSSHRESALEARAGTVLIPDTCFDSQAELEKYFSYNYPWGPTHNGAALMVPAQATIVGNYLQLQSDYTGPQAGDNAGLSYNSGTVHAKQHLTVAAKGGLDIQASFVAPVDPGEWPACWLTAVQGWPPEIDLAEWKGSENVFFNTFNTSTESTSQNFPWPTPTTAWQTVLVKLTAEADDSTLKAEFSIKGDLVTTQYGANMVGKPFWLILDYQMLGSSGTAGPTDTTYFLVKSLSVTSHNP
ncbi:unnamed protein product [Discula destructiva]